MFYIFFIPFPFFFRLNPLGSWMQMQNSDATQTRLRHFICLTATTRLR